MNALNAENRASNFIDRLKEAKGNKTRRQTRRLSTYCLSLQSDYSSSSKNSSDFLMQKFNKKHISPKRKSESFAVPLKQCL